MMVPVSVSLDEDVCSVLEAEAKDRGMGLAAYIRQLASDAAQEARRKRIRAQSAAVGRYVANSPEGRAFYQDWGTPTTDPG